MHDLQDATAVITGAGSGIGRASAHSLARRGVRVVVADIDTGRAAAVAGEITAAGGHAVPAGCDVAAEGTFERLKDLAIGTYGRVDIVMNNVGVLTRGLPDHLPLSEWQRLIDINLMSVVRSNAVFLPLLIGQRRGHIVNTASFAGLYTYAVDRLPYAATKAAVIQISEGLRLYLEPSGVGVTVLCPGPVATNIAASLPSFGPAVATVGPGDQFAVLDPAVVGEQVAEAIVAGTFMVYTHEQVRDVLVERAGDWNAFVAKQAQRLPR